MKQLWRAWTGRHGLAPWWVSHALLYLLLRGLAIIVASLYLVGNPSQSVANLFFVAAGNIYFHLPQVLFTVLLTGVAWKVRGLSQVRFRLVVIMLCCAPLVCTPDLLILAIVVPVQFSYALLMARPRWVDPWERDHAAFASENFPQDRGEW